MQLEKEGPEIVDSLLWRFLAKSWFLKEVININRINDVFILLSE